MPTPLVAPSPFGRERELIGLQEGFLKDMAARNAVSADLTGSLAKAKADIATGLIGNAHNLADVFGGAQTGQAIQNYVNLGALQGYQPTGLTGDMTGSLDDLRLQSLAAQIGKDARSGLPKPSKGTMVRVRYNDADGKPQTMTVNAQDLDKFLSVDLADWRRKYNFEVMEPVTPTQAPATARLSTSTGSGGGAQAVYNGLVTRGMPAHIAAGFVGNIDAESAFNPAAYNSEEEAYGLAQWTPNGGRRDRLHEMYGANPTLDQQLDFIMWELGGPESPAWQKILTARDAQEAAALIDQHYERSSGEHRNKRVQSAGNYYNQFASADTQDIVLPEGWTDNGDGTFTGSEGGLYGRIRS